MTLVITSQKLRPVVLAISTIPLFGCVSAQPESSSESVFDDRDATFGKLEDRGFRGLVAIADEHGEVVYSAIGAVSRDNTPSAEEVQIDIGSITKTLTATAMLKLIDAGEISSSDRLSQFFSEVPEDKAAITIHHLLTHSAGFPGYVASDDSDLSKKDFLNRAFAVELMFKPGTGYEYSNVGYSLAAAIIEEVSGKSYEQYIREDLFEGEHRSSVGYEAAFDPSRSLITQSGKDIASFSWGGSSHWALIGNGGLVATAKDIIEFRQHFLAGEIVSNAAISLAQAPLVREGENAPTHYGYGMVVEDHPWFGRVYWHNGGNEQFSANWTHYVDAGYIVFTASNTPEFGADLAGLVIAESIFDRKILPD